jgi:hypothetical protein
MKTAAVVLAFLCSFLACSVTDKAPLWIPLALVLGSALGATAYLTGGRHA